ncbi:30S ribosomal protein S20 [Candidatus Saccharibacteria bacterium 32-50-13]|nr:MAG: 30S ribosomal protein S20 [Candidatus Saccharibacteria bacterium 32-50-13]
MPIIKSAIKRAKQTIKRRERNVGIKRDIKSAVKAFHAKPSAITLSAAHSELDTAVKKGLLKKNTVARRKSQLARVAKEAGVKLSPAKKTAAKATAPKTATKAPAATKTAAKKPATTAAKKPATKKAPAKKPAAKKAA